jgi:hypothetical protein
VIEVVAEQAIGTFFPVRRPDGTRAIVEPYRQDLPWTAPPPTTGRWTTDEEIQAILAAVDIEVDHLTPVEGGLVARGEDCCGHQRGCASWLPGGLPAVVAGAGAGLMSVPPC